MQHNEEEPKQTDIVMLPENDKGHDIVIGDVHGGLPRFKEWLASLKSEDRGFCVGDLVDRGVDNAGVVLAIIEHNDNPDNGKVYAVRGNHEEMCLNAINEIGELLMRIQRNDGSIEGIQGYNADCVNYIENNGGAWLEDLYFKEVETGLIAFNGETGAIDFSDNSKVGKIYSYMSSLPYVMRVEGVTPFNIVHADMPFDDDELRLRFNQNISMSEAEKKYATWARELKDEENNADIYMEDVGRKPYSVLAIVGHNVVRHVIDNALRSETNTVDLDFWSFRYDAILALNVTTGEAYWVGDTLNQGHDREYYQAQTDVINLHMKDLLGYKSFIQDVMKCNSLHEFDQVVYDYAPADEIEEWRKMAMNYGAVSDDLIRQVCEQGKIGTLLDYGLDVDFVFKDGTTLLFDAIMRNDVDSINVLAKDDIDLTLMCDTKYKTMPLDAAISSGSEDVFLAVAQAHLYDSIKRNDKSEIEYALKLGANIFHQSEDGSTPLRLAKERGCYDFLLSCSAVKPVLAPDFVKNKSEHQWTELHMAAISGDSALYNRLNGNPHLESRIPYADFKLMLSENNKRVDDSMLKIDERDNVCITPAQIAKIQGLQVAQTAGVGKTNFLSPRVKTPSPDLPPPSITKKNN